jgi:hypothetical protein
MYGAGHLKGETKSLKSVKYCVILVIKLKLVKCFTRVMDVNKGIVKVVDVFHVKPLIAKELEFIEQA